MHGVAMAHAALDSGANALVIGKIKFLPVAAGAGNAAVARQRLIVKKITPQFDGFVGHRWFLDFAVHVPVGVFGLVGFGRFVTREVQLPEPLQHARRWFRLPLGIAQRRLTGR